jgi:hypothetical protein
MPGPARARTPAAPGAGARDAARPPRPVGSGRRDPVSRSAQATAALMALGLVAVGLLAGAALDGGPQALLGAAAGMIVAGLALDVYARALGAWAARDRLPLAALVAVVGSPAVLWHALSRRRGRVAPEPGAGAGLLVPVGLVVVLWAASSV